MNYLHYCMRRNVSYYATSYLPFHRDPPFIQSLRKHTRQAVNYLSEKDSHKQQLYIIAEKKLKSQEKNTRR